MYRNRKLLNLAHKVEHCQLELPGVCEGYTPNGCEPAHSNQVRHGKGTGMKAHDAFHVAACHSCHAELDNGKLFKKQDKADYWNDGFAKTMLYYFQEGWLKVG